jgi:hypothetical protein
MQTKELAMSRNLMIKALCLALTGLALAGCVVVPARGYYRPAPVYYWR